MLGTQVARRTQLNGPKRVTNTAPGLHPLQRDVGPWSPGEAGWRGQRGPACSGNTQPAQPRSGGGGGAGREAGPAGLQGSSCAGIYNNNVIKVKGRKGLAGWPRLPQTESGL